MSLRRFIRPVSATTFALLVLVASHAPAAPPSASSASANDAARQPTKRSPVPTVEEWLKAEPLPLSRVSFAAASCVSTRVREWVRVRCPIKTFAISLLGGSNEGLAFWIGPEEKAFAGEVQFPMRPGDRRVVQFWIQGKDSEGGAVPAPSLVLQEHWIEGEASPTITVL